MRQHGWFPSRRMNDDFRRRFLILRRYDRIGDHEKAHQAEDELLHDLTAAVARGENVRRECRLMDRYLRSTDRVTPAVLG